MAGLTIDGTSYGRSASGAKVLKNDFSGDIDNLIKILNGDKYANFKKTINAYWVGADATDFLNDIEKTRKELETKLKSLKSRFNAAIDADAKQFGSFQSKNNKNNL